MHVLVLWHAFNGILYVSGPETGILDKVYQRLRELWQQIFGRTNSGFMEFYKSFIIQKGFIILILAIYLFANCKRYTEALIIVTTIYIL